LQNIEMVVSSVRQDKSVWQVGSTKNWILRRLDRYYWTNRPLKSHALAHLHTLSHISERTIYFNNSRGIKIVD